GVIEREAAAERARIEEQGGPLLPALPPGDAATPAAPTPGGGPQAPAEGPDSSSEWRLPILPAGSGPAPLAAILPFNTAVASVAAPAGPATGAPTPGATPAAAGPYRLAGPLRRISGTKEKLVSQPFDLQGRLGRGKPVALIFWAPDYPEAERELVIMSKFFAQALPQFEVYAVSGRLDEQQDESIWERFSMLDLPASLPLLVDDTFVVSKALTVTDIPDLAVFDAKGVLLVAKIKDPSQGLVSSQGRLAAAEFLQKVASGAPVEPIKNMFPYYPSSLLVNRCAPAFTARRFNSSESYTFTGKSASGRPTLLMFWSSTCKHCQQEIPQMVDWLKSHPGVVDVVSVTHLRRDNGSDAVHRKVTETYIREQHIPWLVLEDPDNAISELYGSDSTPTTYIVAPGSRIAEIWYYAHSGNYGPAIEEALGKARAVTPCQPPPPHPEARLDFTVAAPDGKRVPIASLVDRPTLVHFWATWCAPCVAELPSLLRLRDRLEKSGTAHVVLVSVEAEADGPKIAAFGKKQGLDLRSYRAPAGGVADRVDLAHRVPRTYLVGAGGTVLALREGSQSWDDPALAARIESRLAVLGGGAKH
ncbi:MAG TPA: TlpA family protein disulfide reductase, partial [Dongiaceae bacterium]|nr:TlpA family protein disulfide reductase [Dongiaceae bacterium]